MKNILFILISVLLAITSCKKEEKDEEKSNSFICTHSSDELNNGTIKNDSLNHYTLTFTSNATEYTDKFDIEFCLITSNQNISGTYIFSESSDPYTFTASTTRYINSSSSTTAVAGTVTSFYSSGDITINLSNNIYEISFKFGNCDGYYKGSLN